MNEFPDHPDSVPEPSDCSMRDHDESECVAVCGRCGVPQGLMRLHVRTFVLRVPNADDLPSDASLSQRIAQSELNAYTATHDRLPKCPRCDVELRLGRAEVFDYGVAEITEMHILNADLGRLSRLPARLRKLCLAPYTFDPHELLYRERWQ